MRLQNKVKFLSLYFSSIGIKQSLEILLSLFILPFKKKANIRSKFHRSFSALHDGHKSFSYSSARSSLLACLKAAEIGGDDEVLLSSFTCLAVPTAVIAAGAKPKYCDIDPSTLNVDINLLEKCISDKTKAVVIQHTLGSILSSKDINKLRKHDNLIIIEDCALSIGSTDNGKLIGTSADAAIFSLELSKTISCGWGGVLLVNNDQLEKKINENYKRVKEIRLLKSIRMALQTSISGVLYSPYIYPFGKYFISLLFKIKLFAPSTPNCELQGEVEEDFMCKMPKTLLPLANRQIARLKELTFKHQENFNRLRKKLTELDYQLVGTCSETDLRISPRVAFLVEDRDVFIDFFNKRGIEVGLWFDGPLTPLPENKSFNYNIEDYPNSSLVAKHIVNLPCHAKLNQKDLTYIEASLNDFKNSS